MTLQGFFLVCFFVGLFWSALALLAGGHQWHVPGLHRGGLHVHGHGHGHGHGATGGSSAINPTTVAAFLAWFGGVGYLFIHHSAAWAAASVGAGAVAGLAAGAVVFSIFRRLEAEGGELDPADFELVGVLGEVASPIRPGGVGEIRYSQGGTRRSIAARAAEAIEKGVEVVVLKYERGVVEVRRLDELAAEGAAGGRETVP